MSTCSRLLLFLSPVGGMPRCFGWLMCSCPRLLIFLSPVGGYSQCEPQALVNQWAAETLKDRFLVELAARHPLVEPTNVVQLHNNTLPEPSWAKSHPYLSFRTVTVSDRNPWQASSSHPPAPCALRTVVSSFAPRGACPSSMIVATRTASDLAPWVLVCGEKKGARAGRHGAGCGRGARGRGPGWAPRAAQVLGPGGAPRGLEGLHPRMGLALGGGRLPKVPFGDA